MNPAVYDALPGAATPVEEIRAALARLWDSDPADEAPAPSEFRASQMNLVLHFGLDATPEAARAGFETALRFAQRYPCRIIALCPRAEGGGGEVSAKIFSECHLGASGRDKTCVEAILLTYPLEQRAYLENQASIMLESDLPVYYWPQRIQSAGRLGDYGLFLKEAQRVVIDSAVERPEVPGFAWPRPEAVRDLAFARMLPVRQSVGHFLSYVAPERLVGGLERVTVRHAPACAAEARVVLAWSRRGVEACGAATGVDFALAPAAGGPDGIVVEWDYATGGRMRFAFDFENGAALLESATPAQSATVRASVRPLAPEAALAEALFF